MAVMCRVAAVMGLILDKTSYFELALQVFKYYTLSGYFLCKFYYYKVI